MLDLERVAGTETGDVRRRERVTEAVGELRGIRARGLLGDG